MSILNILPTIRPFTTGFKAVFLGSLLWCCSPIEVAASGGEMACLKQLKSIDKKIDVSKIPNKCTVARSLATWINLKNSNVSFEEGVAFILAHPDWPIWNKLVVNLETSIKKTTPKEAVINWFSKQPPRTLHGIHALVDRLSPAEAAKPEIRKIVQNFWITFTFSPTEQKAFQKKYHVMLSPEAYQQRVERLLWDEKVALAATLLPHVAKAKQDTYDQWIKALKGKTVSGTATQHPGIAVALSQKLRRTEHYLDAFALLLAVQPKRTFTLPNKYFRECAVIVRELVSLKHYDKALKLAESTLPSSTASTDYHPEFHWLCGWVATAHLCDGTKGAYYLKKAFELTTSSFEKAQYAFWAGYAYDRSGVTSDRDRWYGIASQYPQTYYGQIACDALGKPLELASLDISKEALRAFAKRPVVQAALVLNHLGHHKLKSVLWDHLAHTLTTVDEQKMGLYLTKLTSIPYFAFHYYEEANKLLNLPVKDTWLKVEFESTKLYNPHLIQAIVYNESRFNPRIRDSLGAVGFMQIMPTTLRHITTTNGISKINHEDLGNHPRRSLVLGETYLWELSERFNHMPILIAAAYNGGPSRLSKWREKVTDPASNYDFLWLESFPVYDTRKYMKRVLTALRLYDELGADVPIRTVEEFIKDFEMY